MKTKYIPTVANKVDNPKISFTLEITGEWDFNRDIAGNEFEETLLTTHNIQKSNSFKEAFNKLISDLTFERVNYMFETIKISKLECSDECNNSFLALKEKVNNQSKEKMLEALKEHEKAIAKIKSAL